MARKPLVALVGRPNVGKSTLFNRLVGERLAVTNPIPGTTRDRLHGESYWNGVQFRVVDTGGIEVYQPKGTRDENPLSEGSYEFVPLIRQQAMIAIEQADVIVFVVDIRHGVTAADREITEILRRSSKPVVVAANKADDLTKADDHYEFYALGVGEVIPCSAVHGVGVGDLLDAAMAALPTGDWLREEEAESDHLRIAVVGRPNAGKSTLINKLIGEDRVIVSPVAGTTRDAIDTDIVWHGQQITLIDTAGIRRRGRIEPGVEQFSVIRAMNAIERCDVAILMIDAEQGVTEQDEHIAGYVLEQYKSLVVVVNKWDALDKHSTTMLRFDEKARERLHFIPYAPFIYISALTGQRIHQVLETANRVYEARHYRLSTSELNRMVRAAVQRHPPTMRGTRRLKIYFASQVRTAPPVLLFHVNDRSLIHFTYRRYLENCVREKFPFEGTPLRLSFRSAQAAPDRSEVDVRIVRDDEAYADEDYDLLDIGDAEYLDFDPDRDNDSDSTDEDGYYAAPTEDDRA
ncbi:MAG: ribosome biogenesis GTPase Der [Anaerolineae bacterium]|jgi:GTP-binding protein|nr:ribosome biogenesis GTPase Der [Anaerolineae bacterium]